MLGRLNHVDFYWIARTKFLRPGLISLCTKLGNSVRRTNFPRELCPPDQIPWRTKFTVTGHLQKLLSKDLIFVTSLGVYTVKTGIVSCFIAENIRLLTFCHGLWWIQISYSPNLAALAQYNHMHCGILRMCENTQNGAQYIWPVAKIVILRYIYIYIYILYISRLQF